jgi:hypothetical protein
MTTRVASLSDNGQDVYVFNIDKTGCLSLGLVCTISYLDHHQFDDVVGVLDHSGHNGIRRPEPEESIRELVERMMEEVPFDYDAYNSQSPLVHCVHGEAA